MASFNDTVDLERAFLKAMTSGVIMARMYLHQAKEEMFTSEERKFIFCLAEVSLNDANSLLTRAIFEYEVGSRLDDKIAVNFLSEWELVDGMQSFDAPEAILAKLKDADLGRRTLAVSESIVAMLKNGKVQDAAAYMKSQAMLLGGSKTDRPLVNLTDTKDRMALIHDKRANPDKYQGIKIGFPTFDKYTGGLFPGELTLLAGITGLGKSTMCRMIAKGVTDPILNPGGKNVLHIANEEYLEQVQYKYDAVMTGIPYHDFKRARITDEALDRWQKYMQEGMKMAGRGQVFVKEVPAFTDTSLIEQAYRILENRGIQIHVIIIDHLPHVKPIQPAWGENDERAKAAADCKELARWLRLSVVTPTQAATEVEKKTTSGKRAGKMDVYGSKGQIHVANTFMIIQYKGTDDTQVHLQDYERDVFWFCDAKKNRDGAPFNFVAKHYVNTGIVEEVVDPAKKPSKEANKDVEKALKEAETPGTQAKSASIAPKTVPDVSPIPVKTGIRDESMQFAEALEADGEDVEEDGQEKAPLSSVEDQVLKEALGEVSGEKSTVGHSGESTGVAKEVPRVKKGYLAAIQAKKVNLGGV